MSFTFPTFTPETTTAARGFSPPISSKVAKTVNPPGGPLASPPTRKDRYATAPMPSSRKQPTRKSLMGARVMSHSPQRGDDVVDQQDRHGSDHDGRRRRGAHPRRRRLARVAPIGGDEPGEHAEHEGLE